MPEFQPSEPAARAVDWLVAQYHPKLAELGVEVRASFRDDVQESNGREVPYTVQRIAGRNAWMARGGLYRTTTAPVSAPAVDADPDYEHGNCADCGGPLCQGIAPEGCDYAGEVVRWCEATGCTRWMEHLLVPREEPEAGAAAEPDEEEMTFDDCLDPAVRMVFGEPNCPETCEECDGTHHWIEGYLDQSDEEMVASFYRDRPGMAKLDEEQAGGFYDCKHCSAIGLPDFGDDEPEATEHEVSEVSEFGSVSKSHPAPQRTPDLAAPFFLIEISLPIWQDLDDHDRLAMLDEALCQCHASRTEKSGTVTIGKRRGVMLFPENLRRFGPWNEAAVLAQGALEPAPQVALPFDEIGSLDARVSPQQAESVLRGPRPVLEVVGFGSIEPGDLDGAEGQLRQVLTETEPGTVEDAADQEVFRALQDTAEEVVQEPDPARFPPALTLENGGAPEKPRSRRKETVPTPDATGFAEHKQSKRAENLAGAAGS